MFSAELSGLLKLDKDLEKIGKAVDKNKLIVVELAANEYKNDVQPALPYLTGTLRRSVHVELQASLGTQPAAVVGTNVAYARRLEYGFVGKDSLGRVYNQPPRPVWRPVFDHNRAKYERILAGVFNRQEWESDVATFESVRPDLTGGIS
jgi:hypothetical protein